MKTLIVQAWKMGPGEEMFIPSRSKKHADKILSRLKRELTSVEEFDLVLATCLHLEVSFKDGAYWVKILKLNEDRPVAYKKKGKKIEPIFDRDIKDEK